jgi:hypothetical protein
MPIALIILSLAEHLMNLAMQARQNNAQTKEMTPEQEAEFDQRVAAIRSSPEADPTKNV